MGLSELLKRLRHPAPTGRSADDLGGDLGGRALRAVVEGLLLWVLLFFGALSLSNTPHKSASAAVGLALFLSLLTSLYWLGKGRFRLASWVFVVATWAFLGILIAGSGGMTSPLLAPCLAVIVTAAWLLGRGPALLIAGISVAATLAVAILAGPGPGASLYTQNGSLATWAIVLIVVAVAILPLTRLLQTLGGDLAGARRQVEDLRRVEAALRRSEAEVTAAERRYRAFIAGSADALWRVECGVPVPIDLGFDEFVARFYQQGRLAECNDAYARMMGRERAEELAGASVDELMPRDDPRRAEQMREILRAGLRGGSVELSDGGGDGGGTHRVVTLTPIVEGGRLAELWGVSCDITRLKRTEFALRESEKRYRTLFDSARTPLFLMRDGEIVECNPRSEEVFGWPAVQMSGRTLDQLSPARQPDGRDSRQAVFEYMVRAEAETTQCFEWQHIKASGAPFHAEVCLDPVPLANGMHLLASIRDITDRKQRERELRELKGQLEKENLQLREVIHVEQESGALVGESEAMRRVLEDIRTVGPTSATVLILGETGSGKELVARAVHQGSQLADRPLVTVNCAALAGSLIESEFFGHERGAFTGAVARKRGRFELADGGTIFLDEVGDLPLDLQAKLLRVLQHGEFERVGGTQTLKVNVRVIAATNRNLQEAARVGSFRSDLYYRLNVFPIEVPPLRKRRGDIPLLVQYFLARLSHTLGKPLTSVAPDSLDQLMMHDWPGNVRELLHVLERGAIRTRGTVVEVADVVVARRSAIAEKLPSPKLEDVERTHILEVLGETNWVIEGPRGAAARVGLHPNTLRYRMKKLGIERPAR